MRTMSGIVAALCMAPLAIVAIAPARAADQVTLRVADSFPGGHYISDQVTKWFMDRVVKETGNKVAFQYYPSEQLGKAKDLLSLTQTGVVDIGYVAPSFVTDKLPLSVVAELPSRFSKSCEGTAAFYKLATDGIIAKRELEPNGVRLLFTIVLPPYQIFLRSPTFPGIDALKGLKIRTSGKAKELAVQRLGAVSLQIASPDIYQALSRGTIDGMLFPYSSIFLRRAEPDQVGFGRLQFRKLRGHLRDFGEALENSGARRPGSDAAGRPRDDRARLRNIPTQRVAGSGKAEGQRRAGDGIQSRRQGADRTGDDRGQQGLGKGT
jgi:TRAP-type C4-dicarboxylate transport system substrate-binding protein